MSMRCMALGLGWLMAISVASVAAAGPAVATRWNNAHMSQEECLKRAEETIARVGFGGLERSQQSRFGTREDYTASVRCIVSNWIVVFIASGPSRTRADELAGALFQNFKVEQLPPIRPESR